MALSSAGESGANVAPLLLLVLLAGNWSHTIAPWFFSNITTHKLTIQGDGREDAILVYVGRKHIQAPACGVRSTSVGKYSNAFALV